MHMSFKIREKTQQVRIQNACINKTLTWISGILQIHLHAFLLFRSSLLLPLPVWLHVVSEMGILRTRMGALAACPFHLLQTNSSAPSGNEISEQRLCQPESVSITKRP